MTKKPRKDPHAVALGRKGGTVKSAAKAKAARENAKRRQRPARKRTVADVRGEFDGIRIARLPLDQIEVRLMRKGREMFVYPVQTVPPGSSLDIGGRGDGLRLHISVPVTLG